MLRRDDKGVKGRLRRGDGEARSDSTGLNLTHRKDRDVCATREVWWYSTAWSRTDAPPAQKLDEGNVNRWIPGSPMAILL